MRSEEFLKRVFKTGIATEEEIIQYMLKNYYLKGLTIKDFENDVVKKSKTHSEYYARCLADSFYETMKKWSK